ncbi:MAG TPA: hypothetical protein VN691_03285 [Steroidobacteraceae bacterium]|nr:hypothetical protein [Steroidobacteraceae bacterium]
MDKVARVAAFKLFLHFARTGKTSIGRVTDREHDSLFEEQVAEALRAEGYDVRAQISIAGFFVDLAVVEPALAARHASPANRRAQFRGSLAALTPHRIGQLLKQQIGTGLPLDRNYWHLGQMAAREVFDPEPAIIAQILDARLA